MSRLSNTEGWFVDIDSEMLVRRTNWHRLEATAGVTVSLWMFPSIAGVSLPTLQDDSHPVMAEYANYKGWFNLHLQKRRAHVYSIQGTYQGLYQEQ